ncbi:centromere protein X-like isoform X1 [Homalodisca vitripennis]|uniref:centromere protein X-like isoform X1 n=2 Tax=Homalodisca vitripennis TaxID=197043 RepID=UPI001EEAD624|nr:centromere protein X-like isoform X1 [Homalodisca vitripennis]
MLVLFRMRCDGGVLIPETFDLNTTLKMAGSPERTFKSETTKEVLKLYFRGQKTRVTDEATQMVAEVTSLAVVEAVLRAGKQAKAEGSSVIQAGHLEKIIPQLILDL